MSFFFVFYFGSKVPRLLFEFSSNSATCDSASRRPPIIFSCHLSSDTFFLALQISTNVVHVTMAVALSWIYSLLWLWLLLFMLLMVHGESDHHRSSNQIRHPPNNHHHNNNKNNKANHNHQKNRQNNNIDNDKDQEYHHGHGSSRQWLFQPVHPTHHPPSTPLNTPSPPPPQPSLIYPGQPRYVRAVDEGLYYGVIHPYLPEVTPLHHITPDHLPFHPYLPEVSLDDH